MVLEVHVGMCLWGAAARTALGVRPAGASANSVCARTENGRISMKSQTAGSSSGVQSSHTPARTSRARPTELQARQILYGLMVPSMLMPFTSSMARVALPIIRDDFQISADMTAWVATAFSLPFMVLMPVYGRLSDGVGRRRLLLAGILVFSVGTIMAVLSSSLGWIMVGRALQGVGTAGIMPLSMAFLSVIFRPEERGKALGTWSSIGPITAFVGPLMAGFLVEGWGWRAAFAAPFVLGITAFVVVARVVPAGLSTIRPHFLRRFDWLGVSLLAAASTCLLFYLSSRPITDVAPLLDWRLLLATLGLLLAFVWWERRRPDPFVALGIFRNRIFSLASCGAALRMFSMGASGFLLPLYLADIHGLGAALIGVMSTIVPGAMAFMVRLGGQTADRRGSRRPVLAGFAVQVAIMLAFARLPADASMWVIGFLLVVNGLGVGIMLAALHRTAMGTMSDDRMGAAAGLYSMIRFAGMVIGTALAGAFLQSALDWGLEPIAAYQVVYLMIAGFAAVGLVVGATLKESS